MKYEKRWKKEHLLGKGGQGEVFLVKETSANEKKLVSDLFRSWPSGAVMYEDDREKLQNNAMDMISEIVECRLNPNFGALKLLHAEASARDPKRSRDRAALEIEAMKKWQHPNLLSLKDSDADELWYVSESMEAHSTSA